jgi:hypothetical protein
MFIDFSVLHESGSQYFNDYYYDTEFGKGPANRPLSLANPEPKGADAEVGDGFLGISPSVEMVSDGAAQLLPVAAPFTDKARWKLHRSIQGHVAASLDGSLCFFRTEACRRDARWPHRWGNTDAFGSALDLSAPRGGWPGRSCGQQAVEEADRRGRRN